MRETIEPSNLKRGVPETGPFPGGHLFTCGRPGRSLGPEASVPDELAESWIDGLPPAQRVHLVSLLGSKVNGKSEYSFYSFRGSCDPPDGRPIFQEWLDERYGSDRFVVHEYPTVDAGEWSIPQDVIDTLLKLILPLLSQGETVVLFDSGGSQRTRQFCDVAGFRRRPEPIARP